MTQEEKNLVIKDLCPRLPYFENWVQYEGKDYIVTGYGHGRVSLLSSPFSSASGPCPLVEEVKPYLRPMSSMTEEEKDELLNLRKEMNMHRHPWIDRILDFYLSHHLDWRGLILMGLALEAPEDMYKTE